MITYNDDDKALILLSQETSLKKRLNAYHSVDFPKQLFYDLSDADKIIDKMNSKNIVAVSILSDKYPKRLLDIYDPPIVLYCRGDLSLLNDKYNIAVVGTRRPTRYGKDVVLRFVREFVNSGATIVSGLAKGIDTRAHSECLECDGKTIAVLANGLDMIYPSENLEIARLIEDKGLLVSEYPVGVSPMAFRFPERNRIISGLATAVVIPEAGTNSGSMITANCAIDQGKDLYVVPGSIFSSQSSGCNLKLKELQAAIATCPEDIIGAVGLDQQHKQELHHQLTFEQQKIVDLLAEDEMHFTQLLEQSQLAVGELTALLTQMEIFGIIRKLSGNYYSLVPVI